MKTLVQLAALGLGVGLCVTPGVAQAFSLSIGGVAVIFSSCLDGVNPQNPTGNNIQCDFTKLGVVDNNNNQADISGTLLVGAGTLTTSGGALDGIVVNLTNFVVTAASGNTSLFGNFGSTPFIQYSHTFNDVNFLEADGPSAQQVLSGGFRSNTAQNVNPNSTITSGVTIGTRVLDNLQVTPQDIIADTVSPFGNPDLVYQSVLIQSISNPKITATLSGLQLAAGQSMYLPDSNCFAMVKTGTKKYAKRTAAFTPEDAEKGCQSFYRTSEPQSTPEPSVLLGSVLMGLFGMASSLKRRLLG